MNLSQQLDPGLSLIDLDEVTRQQIGAGGIVRVERVSGLQGLSCRGPVPRDLRVYQPLEERYFRTSRVGSTRCCELLDRFVDAKPLEIEPTERKMHARCELRVGAGDVRDHRVLATLNQRVPLRQRRCHGVERARELLPLVAIGAVERKAELSERIQEIAPGIGCLGRQA